ncbi:MAG: hypothetical protein IKG52_06760 [Rhodobacteraceae bacterium]|nr:hypothetical protein [Paracoccaceae bacterium]
MTQQIDLTMVLDPSELWADPENTPDWPLARDDYNRAMTGPRSRDDAILRLRDLGWMLNGTDTTRTPTEAERERLRTEFFRTARHVNWRWDALGLSGTAPASPAVAQRATLIVESCHLRGVLRKLDSRKAAAMARDEARRVASLRAMVDNAPDALAQLEAQLAEAEAGEARYQQWLADQAAAARAHELRHQIAGIRSEAAQASTRLAHDAA